MQYFVKYFFEVLIILKDSFLCHNFLYLYKYCIIFEICYLANYKIFYIGHVHLNRVTMAEKEETKKREKIEQRQNARRDENEEVDRSTWAKYTLGLKHQVRNFKKVKYAVAGC